MDHYAVIGHPIDHSLSPEIHHDFARQADQDIVYSKIDVPHNNFEDVLYDFIKQGGCGANITLPFKERAFELVKNRTQAAIDACAANTVVLQDDGSLLADNTDGAGLIQDLTHNHNYCLRQKTICIIGAGGAVRGILGVLLEQAPDKVVIANRTISKAEGLVKHFELKGHVEAIQLDSLGEQPFDLIIHATSAGIDGELPTLPAFLLSKETWCYDLFYTLDKHTPFIDWAVGHGAKKAIDGLGMLVEQAAASFYLWRGVYPDTQPVIKDLRDEYQ